MSEHLLLLLGEGGHSKEMLHLAELLWPNYRYSYILVRGDALSTAKINLPGRIYRVTRPRGKRHKVFLDTLRTILCGLQSLAILVRCWPRAVISAGPGVAVPVCAAAKLLGRKVVFIETGSRIQAPSTTGRIMYRFADLFLVQWPELLAVCPKGIYAGRLW